MPTAQRVAGAPAGPASLAARPPSWWRGHRWPALAAGFALCIGLGLAVRWWLGPQVVTDRVVRADFVQTVVASGHVEAPHRLDVGAQIVGTVLQVPVVEGQFVQAGALLVVLDAGELAATGRQADVAVLQAQARLRQLQEVQRPVAAQALRQAQASLATAASAVARSEELFAQGFIGQAALDASRTTAELADAQRRAAQRQLDTTGAAGSDRALALAGVAGARAGAQAAQARTGYTEIRAPLAGTLIARNVEVGDVVQPGKLLMTLSPQGRTQVVVAIDEKNLSLLALGQTALASADAYPAQRIAATLAYVNPGVNATTGAVEVKLDVPLPPAQWRQDMTVSVDIAVARRARALLVPIAALHDIDAVPWVLRIEGRRALRRPVRLGLRSGGLAEVLAGLAEGDAVLAADAGVLAGAHVRETARPTPPAASAAAAR